MDPRPSTVGVGVATQWVGAGVRKNFPVLLLGDQPAPLRTTQVGGPVVGHDPKPHLPDRVGDRGETKFPDQPQMNVDAIGTRDVEVDEQMLPDGLGPGESVPIQDCGLVDEPSLRGADPHFTIREVLLEGVGETVDDVSFGHCPIPADLGCRRR